jgi:hypothetical protein
MKFELSNSQRQYFGLDPIEPHWEKVILKADTYRPETILYFDGEIIKRHILSTNEEYQERHYHELTKDRIILLPKTTKGKEKKLTGSVLESRQPTGVYVTIDNRGRFFIGNYTTQTTFYDSTWEHDFTTDSKLAAIEEFVDKFMNDVPKSHLSDLEKFKTQQRKHYKFKSGDFFSFKVSKTHYGFGRVLVDVDQLRKSVLSPGHGMNFIMAKPVLVKIYAHVSDDKLIDVNILQQIKSLPSDYMMDNLLLYGQFEIIGHRKLELSEFDFPISYGRHIGYGSKVFLQWGLIHRELPNNKFNKYFTGENPFVAENSTSRQTTNPYGFYSIGFYPKYYTLFEINGAIANGGVYDYLKNQTFTGHFDLRNPANSLIREELMTAFGLDPQKNYVENCLITNTANPDF